MTQSGHRIKWDHFDILATGQSDIHCKIKEPFLIGDLILHLTELFPAQSFLSKLMTCATLVPGPCWGERTDSMTS